MRILVAFSFLSGSLSFCSAFANCPTSADISISKLASGKVVASALGYSHSYSNFGTEIPDRSLIRLRSVVLLSKMSAGVQGPFDNIVSRANNSIICAYNVGVGPIPIDYDPPNSFSLRLNNYSNDQHYNLGSGWKKLIRVETMPEQIWLYLCDATIKGADCRFEAIQK